MFYFHDMNYVNENKTRMKIYVRKCGCEMNCQDKYNKCIISCHEDNGAIGSALDINFERFGVRSSLRLKGESEKSECNNSGYKLTGLTWWS